MTKRIIVKFNKYGNIDKVTQMLIPSLQVKVCEVLLFVIYTLVR